MSNPILNDSGMTELLLAAYSGDFEWIKNCINDDLNIHARCYAGMTALHWIVDMGIVGDSDEREAIVTLLVESGADVNAIDDSGQSVVWRSVAAGNPRLTKLLIAAGADANRADNNNVKPLHVATENQDTAHIEMLSNAGAIL